MSAAENRRRNRAREEHWLTSSEQREPRPVKNMVSCTRQTHDHNAEDKWAPRTVWPKQSLPSTLPPPTTGAGSEHSRRPKINATTPTTCFWYQSCAILMWLWSLGEGISRRAACLLIHLHLTAEPPCPLSGGRLRPQRWGLGEGISPARRLSACPPAPHP